MLTTVFYLLLVANKLTNFDTNFFTFALFIDLFNLTVYFVIKNFKD